MGRRRKIRGHGGDEGWGKARLQPLRNPGYASTCYCMLAVGYMELGVMGVSTVTEVREQQGARSCFAACLLLCILVAALHP